MSKRSSPLHSSSDCDEKPAPEYAKADTVTAGDAKPYMRQITDSDEQAQVPSDPSPYATAQDHVSAKSVSRTKAKSSRKRRDPNTPKRAVCAYVFFAKDERTNIQKEHPGMKFAQVSKLLGERWRHLSSTEKQKYELMAVADRQRVQREMKEYMNSQDQVQNDKKQRMKDTDSYTPINHNQTHQEFEYSEDICADLLKNLSEE